MTLGIRDVGRFVARYFQVLAWLSIAGTLCGLIFLGVLYIDFGFILYFWAASGLYRHSATARKWTVGVLSFAFISMVFVSGYVLGTGGQGATLNVAGAAVQHPHPALLAALMVLMLTMVGMPLLLLLTPQARREFSQPPRLRGAARRRASARRLGDIRRDHAHAFDR